MPNRLSTASQCVPRSEEFAAIRASFQALLPSVEEMHARLKEVFTQKYPNMSERIAAIDEKAQCLHPYDGYPDMIHDELTQDPDRTDEEIAGYIAQLVAFP